MCFAYKLGLHSIQRREKYSGKHRIRDTKEIVQAHKQPTSQICPPIIMAIGVNHSGFIINEAYFGLIHVYIQSEITPKIIYKLNHTLGFRLIRKRYQ